MIEPSKQMTAADFERLAALQVRCMNLRSAAEACSRQAEHNPLAGQDTLDAHEPEHTAAHAGTIESDRRVWAEWSESGDRNS